MNKRFVISIVVLATVLYGLQACNFNSETAVTSEHIPDKISYNFDIRPILSDKCFSCHGPDGNKREAGLRLDIEKNAFEALKENPGAHALVAGKPNLSEAFLRISTKDTVLMMPPPSSNLKLSSHEIKLIEKWIEQGAKYETHWSFIQPKKAKLPKPEDQDWVKNEIDYFILSKMDVKGLSPNPEASKEYLLKRLSFDLTGLPPSIELMDAFLADNSSTAYEKVVDKLLKSPAYGEKMALHWLDVARYADSHGFQDDSYRSQWPWRDWVIHSFNNNLPYDKFITYQLAGDLIPNATKEQILATGFNRNHKITEEGGVVDEEYRVSYVIDRTNTFSKALIGVTLECAQCHDHKYDPFSQKNYYQLYSFFNNVKEVGIESTVAGPETYAKKPFIEITDVEINKILKFINKTDTNKLIVSVMGDRDTLRKTFILDRGAYDAPGTEVYAGTPESILSFDPKYPKNRLGLSQWLFDKRNPLTSRVYVNQLWNEIFGRGIVKTAGDFGMQGELPTHPELLDWLAVDFMNNGWNMKRLVKQMVMSATYRQSAVITSDKLKKDPENVFLSRAPRYRIKAELVRDLVLASSGLLVKTIGGPSVKPYQPQGLWENASSGRGILRNYKQDHGNDLYRRGMYTFIKRTVPPPVMGIFDASNRDQCEVNRLKTNTPLQALIMMNDPTVLEASRVLAAKIEQQPIQTKEKVIKTFRLIVCRKPTEKEIEVLSSYYADQLGIFKNQKKRAESLLSIGEYPLPQSINKSSVAAWMQVISALYNLEETITKT
jgi:hypothetical protein